jgi:acetolactate synthase-1/2/3 large subunit
MTTMREVVETLDRLTADRPVIVASGVGSHQSIVARHFTWDYPRRMFLTSAGHGTMGSGLPLAIGAAVESPGTLVLCVNGDGSMQMDAPQLAMVAELGLPIKVFVLDNQSAGIVRQFEDLQGFRNVATRDRPNPNMAALANAYGVYGVGPIRAGWDQMAKGILAMDGPALLHIELDDYAVWPLLEGGKMEMTEEPA